MQPTVKPTRMPRLVTIHFAVASLAAIPCAACAAPHGYADIYNFTDGADGGYSQAAPIEDKSGTLYGTTHLGGAYNGGTVFRLAKDGTETVLYAFTDGADGGYPGAPLIEDSAHNLYGTTTYGGSQNNDGVVFRIAPNGTETIIHAFNGGSDGANPLAGLIADAAGNLYGTTVYGGSAGEGTVFRIAPDGTATTLHAFTAGADQANPEAALVRDRQGNLFGTTCSGFLHQYGTVFEVSTKSVFSTLHVFNGTDGQCLQASLTLDGNGNLYGTTSYGGANGAGVVFKIGKDGTETILYTFTGGADGGYPVSTLLPDREGNFYGTTEGGGADGGGDNGPGVVFKLAADGTETVLHRFKGGNDGENPEAGLIAGKDGYLYGTARNAGVAGAGIVFKVRR